MGNPIQLSSIIVEVYAYMFEIAYYRNKYSDSEKSPACIYFDIHEDREEITFILRLPEKPISYVIKKGNPWGSKWSDQSKYAVLDCAELILSLTFDAGMPMKYFGDHEIVDWRRRVLGNFEKRHIDRASEGKLTNLLNLMLHSDQDQRISFTEVIKGLYDIQNYHPLLTGIHFILNNYER